MAIWAVAHIVRKMSHPDANPSYTIQRNPSDADSAHDAPWQNTTPSRIEAANKNESANGNDPEEQPRSNHQDEQQPPDHQPPHREQLAEMNTLVRQEPEIPRESAHESARETADDYRAGSSDSQQPTPKETAFHFQEIDQRQPLSAVGNTPVTETLEIELGAVHMAHEDVERLGNGVVVALLESVDDEVLIRSSERVVARGKMAIVDGKIAVRISESFI